MKKILAYTMLFSVINSTYAATNQNYSTADAALDALKITGDVVLCMIPTLGYASGCFGETKLKGLDKARTKTAVTVNKVQVGIAVNEVAGKAPLIGGALSNDITNAITRKYDDPKDEEIYEKVSKVQEFAHFPSAVVQGKEELTKQVWSLGYQAAKDQKKDSDKRKLNKSLKETEATIDKYIKNPTDFNLSQYGETLRSYIIQYRKYYKKYYNTSDDIIKKNLLAELTLIYKKFKLKLKDQKQNSQFSIFRKKRNNFMLASISSRTQGPTAHFGSSDYYMANTVPVSPSQRQNFNNQRETIQENPYYEAGTALIEAPADVVLAWGAHPADLDSHMTGPINATSNERFHTSFRNKGNLDNDPNVLLYRDYTDHHSGGANRPEQTRINVTQPGVYNFYVHDYTNRGAEHSTALSNSGAVVSLHSAGSRTLPEGDNLGQKVVEYKVPTNKEGTVWHTFELDTRRNTIKEINQFNNASSPEEVPFNEKSYIK